MSCLKFPPFPNISEEEINKCKEEKNFIPILFEWYKYTGRICLLYASIKINSPSLITIDPLHYAVLIGYLNRCARLMFSNIVLSHKGIFGETTAIIDRCIFETTIKIRWLCYKHNSFSFKIFIASGLKSDLKLKEKILANICKNNNQILPIEQRMLDSIERMISSSHLTDIDVKSSQNLPTLNQMIRELEDDDINYIVGQNLGSHHIHGTWSSLLIHYIELDKDGTYGPRDHNCETHVNQYGYISLVVLQAMDFFVDFMVCEPLHRKQLLESTKIIREEILKIWT